MQEQFIPIARRLADGRYSVERRYYYRTNYLSDWELRERYNEVINSKQDAVEWFRPVAASFRGVAQEEMEPDWVECLPNSIR